MRLLFGSDEYICQWVSARVDANIVKGKAIGVIDGGDRLIAGVAYSNWRGCDIEMLCAAENMRWLSRVRLAAFFSYPFVQLGCLRVTAITAKRNKRARKFIERIGFRLEGTHPRALEGKDACSYGMLRENCKWLRNSNGQKRRLRRTSTA